MNETAELQKMAAPLEFVSKDDFRHLSLVRDFEAAMTGLVHRLKEKLASDGMQVPDNLFVLEKTFAGFDNLVLDEKKARVREALSIINDLFAGFRDDRPHGDSVPPPAEPPRPAATVPPKNLHVPIQYIKGVGPKIAEMLARKGLHTIEDLVYFLPRHYEDRRSIVTIAAAQLGKKETVVGGVLGSEMKYYGRRRVFEAVVGDGTATMTATWFKGSSAYIKKSFPVGQRVILTGEIRGYASGKNMVHPDYELLDPEDSDTAHLQRIIPVYSETEGLKQKTIRRIMMNVAGQYASSVSSPIPEVICRGRGLIGMKEALQALHFPPQDGEIGLYLDGRSDAHRRVIYDEFFFLQLGMALKKKSRLLDPGISFRRDGTLLQKFFELLPYRLTAAQRRVIAEIEADMAKPVTMNRLLQGDVGSGKTVVSMAAIVTACENGYQAALMAPTEILAQQHYANVGGWADRLGLRTEVLIGGGNAAAKKTALDRIEKGGADIVVGTHALIQEHVSFRKLGLAVIDEQHRFGVIQRVMLRQKGAMPDIVVMTATPIPRTLAMTVYGDLDVSVIDEMPPAKKPIRTKVFYEQHREKVYEIIGKELKKGHQAFIVYPLVEESEVLDLKDASRMAEHLQQDVFPEYRIGLIHGRMKSREKNGVMEDFQSGKLHVLVSTTVIEVGIDIPQASLMVIEHAERFGLSQLHQLRGRVGRSDIPSYCILLAQHSGSPEAKQRLRVMEATSDGFRIAEEDLAIRGPGEFLGVRQSGLPDFRVASIVRDARILNEAKTDAFAVVEDDPQLAKPEHAALKAVLMERWKGRLDLAKAG
jgi:ATP-dependent DNA helicase RecG